MKKYIYLSTIIMAASAMLPACKKDFLAEKVYSKFTPDALNDSLAFESSIIGIQSQYNLWNTMEEDPNGNQGFLCAWQMGTDVAYNKAPDDLDPMSIPYTNYEKLTSSDGVSAFVWKWAYVMINNANLVIANIDKPSIQVTTAFRNRIKGQAMFYRALGYNYLATLFGDVPLLKEPLNTPKTDFTRAPVNDVNDLIISDLQFAKANLTTIDDLHIPSTPHTAMASQLLAEVYLRTGRNADAITECDAVINSGKFSLTTSRYGIKAGKPGDPFSDMFIFGNERRSQGNKEAIWVQENEYAAKLPNGSGPDHNDKFPGYRFLGLQQRRVWGSRYYNTPGMLLCDTLGGRGISRMALTYFVLNLYESVDMRNSQYALRRNYYYNNPSGASYGQLVVPGPGIDTNRNIVPKTNKWDEFDPNNSFGGVAVKDIIIMRLGETYLLKAEAQLGKGDPAGAAASINVLRTRANASQVSSSDVNMDLILDERVRELIGEENRRMTLMRTKTLVQRVQGRGLKITGIADKNLLLPVPQSEIDLNKDAVLSQNNGY